MTYKLNDGTTNEIKGQIEFKDVEFVYKDTNITALNKVSLSLNNYNSLAIMGDVGAGKSTILELICGINYATKGNVYIDNINIKKHNLNNLRKYIGYVPQNTFFLSDTIENNILFGKNDAKKMRFYFSCKISFH